MHTAVRRSRICVVRLTLALLATLVGTTACEDDGGSANVGDNDPNLVVCFGDSITVGVPAGGANYPARLAQMTGKAVANAGVNGLRTPGCAGRMNALLAKKPGYVCILLGANDAIHGGSPVAVKEDLRAVVAACKANQSYPILGTLTPMSDSRGMFDGNARAISSEIRALAREEHCALADLEHAFQGHPEYLIDGLHMSESGNQRMASVFKGRL